MLLATKGNREVKISTDDKEKYLDAGYSLFEKGEDGKVHKIEQPVKKTPEMIALEEENATLKERLASLEAEPEEEPEEEPKKPPARGRAK